MKIRHGNNQAPLTPLSGKTVAVLGYGNQGHAHALNLRDSGVGVIVGSREGSNTAVQARETGFDVMPIAEASATADLVILTLPDEVQGLILADQILPAIRPGTSLGFVHGFAVRFNLVTIPEHVGVILVAPKGPGAALRQRFLDGSGLPALIAVHHNPPEGRAKDIALAWANGIGSARVGIIETTFKDETDTDLFGEQAVLCGGVTALMLVAFETLVEAGYPAELAYNECCQELKFVADLIHERGIAGMMQAISNTAEFGAYKAIERMNDDHLKSHFRAMIEDIQSGRFARELSDNKTDLIIRLTKHREAIEKHAIEAAGQSVRHLETDH